MADFISINKGVLKKAYCFLGFFFILGGACYAQNQVKADSLEAVYTSGNFEEVEKLKLLSALAAEHPNPDISIQYSEALLQLAKALDSTKFIITALMQKGNALRLKGDLSQSLQSYFDGIKIADSTGRKRDIAQLYMSIAGAYSVMENHANTITYYKKAIDIFKELNDTLMYATCLLYTS